ncbi:MAG: glycine cleavage T C-terminal barrel domain-containing protein, partial [Lysobacterales bacterium]
GGNYGFRIGKSLALGMLHPELAAVGTKLRMKILGADHKVTVIPESPYDPKNERLQS